MPVNRQVLPRQNASGVSANPHGQHAADSNCLTYQTVQPDRSNSTLSLDPRSSQRRLHGSKQLWARHSFSIALDISLQSAANRFAPVILLPHVMLQSTPEADNSRLDPASAHAQ